PTNMRTHIPHTNRTGPRSGGRGGGDGAEAWIPARALLVASFMFGEPRPLVPQEASSRNIPPRVGRLSSRMSLDNPVRHGYEVVGPARRVESTERRRPNALGGEACT